MSMRAPERPSDEQGPSRLPALRSQFDSLLDLADEFEGRPSGPAAAGTPLPNPPRDLLPAVRPKPPRSQVRKDMVWLAAVGAVLVVLIAGFLVAGDSLERVFRGDGPYLEDEVGTVGPPASEVRDPGVDGGSPGDDAVPADSTVPEPDAPPTDVAPAGCGAADLLGAAQALTPDVPLTLTDKRCEGPYAVVGLMSAPTVTPEQQVPAAWAAFRLDGATWQRLGGGFILDGSWPDGCRALVAADPAFPVGLCG